MRLSICTDCLHNNQYGKRINVCLSVEVNPRKWLSNPSARQHLTTAVAFRYLTNNHFLSSGSVLVPRHLRWRASPNPSIELFFSPLLSKVPKRLLEPKWGDAVISLQERRTISEVILPLMCLSNRELFHLTWQKRKKNKEEISLNKRWAPWWIESQVLSSERHHEGEKSAIKLIKAIILEEKTLAVLPLGRNRLSAPPRRNKSAGKIYD